MEEKRVCDICGREHPLSELREFDGVLLCESCWNSETIVCEQCGRRIWLDDNEGDGDTPLCGQCYDRYYTTCADCGRTIHQNDAYYEDEDDYTARCYSCHCRHAEHRVIHDYYYKPEPIFYGEGNRYFGVELEIDDGGEDNTNAEKIERIANSENELIYIKHDGSLSEGMEIVTYPMSLDFHLHQMPWADVLAKARNMGYRSHQSGTCGLHVHVNRTAFGETEEEQEAVIARILYFFEKHWEELLKFSRRTQKQLERWADRYGLKEHPRQVLDVAKGSRERYTCVNLTNYHTVEFRMFRGTLKLNTLTATLQLLDRICDVAIYLSDDELKDLSWTTFVSGCAHLPELVQYLKERRLYINEPVTAEAEV
ncbi:MAG: amidoligase family protein [Clostridiales bacterium]|nr:amidoligase family protein [Clostridiales bacterium]